VGQRSGHDVVVIGGGPAGCAAAATLARTGRSVVLVVDTQPHRTFGVGEGGPPGLDRAVNDVFGDGTFVPTDHLRSLGNRAAWGSSELVLMDFMFNPFGTGWHLDRVSFDARLLAAAEAAGATVRTCLDGGHAMLAPVVIDASGRHAHHARHRGTRRIAGDRLLAALASYQRADTDDDATTTVEAVETGWLYTCPVPHHRRVVAFLTDGDLLAAELRTSAGFDRHARRTSHIAPLLGRGAPETPLVIAAGTAHLERPYGDGWLAAGDAAASFDPLSSQGIVTAVLMGREAARCIDEPTAYAARYQAIVAQFEAERRTTYRRERRWPTAPFWSRRHPRPIPPSSLGSRSSGD
jgi:flavin-dependent dehydrogenase